MSSAHVPLEASRVRATSQPPEPASLIGDAAVPAAAVALVMLLTASLSARLGILDPAAPGVPLLRPAIGTEPLAAGVLGTAGIALPLPLPLLLLGRI